MNWCRARCFMPVTDRCSSEARARHYPTARIWRYDPTSVIARLIAGYSSRRLICGGFRFMATASDDNFDWVSAQAGCSAIQMFQKLQDGAKADVDRRNAAASGRSDQWRFEFHDDDDGFEVVRIAASSKDGAAVTFAREG